MDGGGGTTGRGTDVNCSAIYRMLPLTVPSNITSVSIIIIIIIVLRFAGTDCHFNIVSVWRCGNKVKVEECRRTVLAWRSETVFELRR